MCINFLNGLATEAPTQEGKETASARTLAAFEMKRHDDWIVPAVKSCVQQREEQTDHTVGTSLCQLYELRLAKTRLLVWILDTLFGILKDTSNTIAKDLSII